MSSLSTTLQRFQELLPTVTSPEEGLCLFEQLLLENGFETAPQEAYDHFKPQLLDPLHLSYPKVPRGESWYARANYASGPDFVINLRGNLFPLKLSITDRRVNPPWDSRIIPSIGAYVLAELESYDSTFMLCGAYTPRKEKIALKALEDEYRSLREKLDTHDGRQKPQLLLTYDHGVPVELIYESDRRKIRENEALLLIRHFES